MPLATALAPLATRHYLPKPFPAGCCLTPTAELTKPNGTRSRRADPLSHYAPNQAIPAEKSIRFFPTRRRPTVDRSLVAWRRSTPAAPGVPAGSALGRNAYPLSPWSARPWKGARCMISCVAKNRRFLVWTMGSTSCSGGLIRQRTRARSGNRMRENCTSGSVRGGTFGNRCP